MRERRHDEPRARADDALIAQATSLDDEAALDAVLGDARASTGVRDFFKQWLLLDKVPHLPSMDTPAFEAFAAGENVGQPGHDHRGDMINEVLDLGTYYTLTTAGRYEDLLTTPYSFVATSHSLLWNGIKPVFVDIAPDTLNMDPARIEAATGLEGAAIALDGMVDALLDRV